MATKSNEMFEMLVKITGDNSVAKKTLQDLKKEAAALDKQLQGMKLGSKEFEELQVKATNLKTAIKGLERPTDKFVKSNKSATTTAMNLSRIIQDLPYGYMAIANNIDVAWESSVRLTKEMGGAKKAIRTLISTMAGPTGLLLGVSAVNALVVAFGDDLWNAIAGSNEEAEKLLEKLDTIESYTPIDIAVRIKGLEGAERIKAELDLLIARKNYLEGISQRRQALEGAEPSAVEKVLAFFGGSLGAGAVYGEKKALQRKYHEEDTALAKRVSAGEITLGDQEDIRLMTEFLEMSEVAAKERVKANKNKLEIKYKEMELTQQEQKEAEDAQKEVEAASKKAQAERVKLEKEKAKERDAILKAQELTYSSMISNIKEMVANDVIKLEDAIELLQSGPIGERYDDLLAVIDKKIPQVVDDLIRKELEVIRGKLAAREPITKANERFLVEHGGVTKYDAGFLYGVGKATKSVEKDGGGQGKELRTFRKYRAENAKSMENIGEQFEDTAVDAFEQSVSLFSAQLAAAIMQGGYTFSEILSNVATMFGQLLLQFIIEAFAQEIAGSFLKVIGLAEGTPAAPPGYTWVGEKGPELVRFQGGEEVVPANQVGRRLDALYNAGLSAQDFGRSGDVSGVINALDRQTRAMLKDRLNYEITDRGNRQIARATKKREGQIRRYT